VEDVRHFGHPDGRLLLRAIIARLANNPVDVTRNLKVLRPNPAAQRELRILGRYRALFDLDIDQRTVQVKVVGEKRGNALFVRGKKYEVHHESDLAE
jgi:mRNA-degrading endonuclease RelE of RelBE toxin-antitoxin system